VRRNREKGCVAMKTAERGRTAVNCPTLRWGRLPATVWNGAISGAFIWVGFVIHTKLATAAAITTR
jgi:hypothetical protein